jgi:acetoin utilization protein AcuB
MSKAIPKISKYMTQSPCWIDAKASVIEAMDLMQKEKVRHLPVTRDSKIIGMLSERDLKTLFSLVGSNVNPNKILAEDACTDQPYTTKPDALLNEVVTQMANKKYGSAVVLDEGKLVGIFTAVDACVALSDICEKRFHA